MNRHETHPVRGRVFDEEFAREDLLAMKRAGVNAVRTSHYPPHPRVLDLLDELGFWVVLECDLETHGFVFADWAGNPSDDPAWAEAYLDRIERTVERDKNHASVVVWSLGNEAWTGRNLAAMADWVHRRDPSRPVHYEGDHSCSYTDLYSRMYPNYLETAAIGSDAGFVDYLHGPAEAVRIRSRPTVLCEYVHAMGNGPGGVRTYDDLFEEHPRLHGGFVWEWRDHGLLAHRPDGTEFYAYGGDFGEVVHDGNFVMDGMVLPDGTPTPGLAEWSAVNAPVRLECSGTTLRVRNRQHSATTAGLRFVGVREVDGHAGRRGADRRDAGRGRARPGTLALPAALLEPAQAGETWLSVRAELAHDTPWAPAGHVVARTQCDLTPPVARPAVEARRPDRAAPGRPVRHSVRLGPAELDLATGLLTRLGDLAVSGPRLELWRAPTDNDRSGERGSYELGAPEDTPRRGRARARRPTQRWRERGLDRLVHRVTAVEVGGRTRPSSASASARATQALGVDVTLPLPARAATPWRCASRCSPTRAGTAPGRGSACASTCRSGSTGPRGSGPGRTRATPTPTTRRTSDASPPTWPGSTCATRARRRPGTARSCASWSCATPTAARLVVRTRPARRRPPPRLHADRRGRRSSSTGRGTRTSCRRRTRTFLFLDDAVHGIGSRACGMDVLPEHALWPGARAFEVELSLP